jgi:hypothetical protein
MPQPFDTLAIFDSKTPYFCVTKYFRNSFLLPNAKAGVTTMRCRLYELTN